MLGDESGRSALACKKSRACFRERRDQRGFGWCVERGGGWGRLSLSRSRSLSLSLGFGVGGPTTSQNCEAVPKRARI